MKARFYAEKLKKNEEIGFIQPYDQYILMFVSNFEFFLKFQPYIDGIQGTFSTCQCGCVIISLGSIKICSGSH